MNRQRASPQQIPEPRAPTRQRRFFAKPDPGRTDPERSCQRIHHHAGHRARETESRRDDGGGDLARRRRDRAQQNETSSPPRNRANPSSPTTNRDRHREPKSRPSGQSRLSIRATARRREATKPPIGRATTAPAGPRRSQPTEATTRRARDQADNVGTAKSAEHRRCSREAQTRDDSRKTPIARSNQIGVLHELARRSPTGRARGCSANALPDRPKVPIHGGQGRGPRTPPRASRPVSGERHASAQLAQTAERHPLTAIERIHCGAWTATKLGPDQRNRRTQR